MEARPVVLRMTAAERLAEAGIDVDAVLHYTAPASHAARAGRIGYALLVAEKP